MKLFVCCGTFARSGHACGQAYEALRAVGHKPEVVKVRGSGRLPDFLNRTAGRREVRKLTGQGFVPVLVTDEQEIVWPSEKIVEWANANPAPGATKPA